MEDINKTGIPNGVSWRKAIPHVISVMLILITLACIFTPSLLILKKLTAYTLYVMLGLLAMGLVFFTLSQTRLMMVSLLCCVALALYLRESTNKQLRLAEVTHSPSIRISHVSLGNAENEYDAVIDYLLGIDVDLLSFQELTPDWNAQLTTRLASRYQYITTLTRLDQYGMGFFSRIPMKSLDTFYYREIPNLRGTISLGDQQDCHIISSQVVPPVNESAFQSIREHFARITAYAAFLPGSKIVLGDFHLPPWTNEVQTFKLASHLKDSRRDIHPRNLDGSFFLPRIPVEHILYTEKLECTSFTEIGNAQVGRIGIAGSYQLESRHEEMGE